MTKARLYCDIDGVLADCVGATMQVLYKSYGIAMPVEAVTEWGIGRCFVRYIEEIIQADSSILPGCRIPTEEHVESCLRGLWGSGVFFSRVIPYLDMHAVLLAYHRLGVARSGVGGLAPLQFVTRRLNTPGVVVATRAWLDSLGFARVPCSHVKDKADYMQGVAPGTPWVFLEDSRQEAEALHACSPQGKAFLLARPWNADAGPGNDGNRVLRCTPRLVARMLGLPASVLPG